MLSLLDADVVDGHDIGMLQGSGSSRFCSKAPDEISGRELPRQNHLYRNRASQTFLAGFVNNAHPSSRDLLQQFVIPEGPAGGILFIPSDEDRFLGVSSLIRLA